MNRIVEFGNGGDNSTAFDLRRLIQSKLYGIRNDDTVKAITFEYDEALPKTVVGAEHGLGELIAIVFNYSWDRLSKGALDIAVQGFDVRKDKLKIQFSFCERFQGIDPVDRLDQQLSFLKAEDDGSDIRLMRRLCGQLGTDLISKVGPCGEQYLAFVVEVKTNLKSQSTQVGFRNACTDRNRISRIKNDDLYREVLRVDFRSKMLGMRKRHSGSYRRRVV